MYFVTLDFRNYESTTLECKSTVIWWSKSYARISLHIEFFLNKRKIMNFQFMNGFFW